MTTLVQFTPNDNQSPPFAQTFVLDGRSYTGTATWNFAAQRWYFTLADQSGNVVWNGGLLGSPDGYDIYFALGVFSSSTILYRANTGYFEVNP